MQIEIIGNWSYAGTAKFVTHLVLRDGHHSPNTGCGLDVYALEMRRGQEWETSEDAGVQNVGCVRCQRLLTKRTPDACPACLGKRYFRSGNEKLKCVVCAGTGKRR